MVLMAVDAHPTSGNGLAVLETPLLRVSRPVAACSRCRAAKVKCDGKLPACTACEKSNRATECSSTNDQFARGKERSYVATLEARVERLEKQIAEARARRKSSTILMQDFDDMTPRQAAFDHAKPVKTVSKRAARRKELKDIDELVSDFGLLAVNATARDFYGFTTEMSYARMILSASAKEPLPQGLTKKLPPRFAATPLIQHWVNNIFTLLPLFEEASLYASVDAVYHMDGSATAFDHWTVRMVLAIACLSQSEQRGDTLYSDAVGHVNAALEHAEEVLHPGFISSIQALILLVEYAIMDPHHFDSWTLVGAASRAMVDLGIHQDPSRSASILKAKLETRRRVYWCVYALDRSTSLVQTRAFSFSDDSANVGLPFHTSLGSPKSSPQAHVFLASFETALDLFRIREIQSQWYMDLFQSGRQPWRDPYPYIWKTYAKMNEWFREMPDNMLPSTKAFYELELLYSYVYILSPSPRVPHISEYAQRLIFEHAIAYVTNLIALLEKPSTSTKPPVTYYDALRAYMTGRQFVDVLSRNLDALLNPSPPNPPSFPTSAVNSNDPLAPPELTAAPLFPSPLQSANPQGGIIQSPSDRAINAVNDFTSTLSTFGLRFGFTHWRDRFQRESGPLLTQLHNRAAMSSPPNHTINTVLPTPTFFPPFLPAATSPEHHMHQLHNPATPPSYYPPQPSPFAATFGDPFATPSTTWGGSPSPQRPSQMPEMPYPSEGRQRNALVYGPGLSSLEQRRGSVQVDSTSWAGSQGGTSDGMMLGPGLPIPGRRPSVQLDGSGELSSSWNSGQGMFTPTGMPALSSSRRGSVQIDGSGVELSSSWNSNSGGMFPPPAVPVPSNDAEAANRRGSIQMSGTTSGTMGGSWTGQGGQGW